MNYNNDFTKTGQFEIRSESGNYFLPAKCCSIDTSEIGPNADSSKFEGARFIDVICGEMEDKGWPLPKMYQSDSTEHLGLNHVKKELTNSGYFYRLDLSGTASIQVFRATDATVSGSSGTLFDGIGGTDFRGHTIVGWAQSEDSQIFLCEKLLADTTDYRFVLDALVNPIFTPCTKDACEGYALRKLGSVSLHYKRPWMEITRDFLREVKF